MKIGIITYNRIYNYGSRLQAYALNRFLTTEGYDVKTIDYAQSKQEEKRLCLYEPVKGIMSVVRNIQIWFYRKSILKSRTRFDEFSHKFLPRTKSYESLNALEELNNEFDCFICGSDQIWNPTYFGFDSAYMLSFVQDKSKCMSYAASIGVSKISQEDEMTFRKYLEHFKCLTVREEKAAILVESCVARGKLEVVLDPVFLLSSEDWNAVSSTAILRKPYVLCYFIGNIEGMREKAKKLANECNLPLVVIRLNLRDWLGRYRRYYSGGPEEFLTLIKNAEYIFTNSFHALAFSVIFQKKFWVFSQDENVSSQSRIETLLGKLGLLERKVYSDSMDVDWSKPIDYYASNIKLSKEIQKSKDVLLNCIRA